MKSSQNKLPIAEKVRDGAVKGMLILNFFPWQLKTLLEKLLEPMSSLLIVLDDLSISSDFDNPVLSCSSAELSCRRYNGWHSMNDFVWCLPLEMWHEMEGSSLGSRE
uniref:Uncharacterized protein n=1 Tax=Opuntia streptacantha TaxID=393608 RepID=A0A7C8YEM7_OPUST